MGQFIDLTGQRFGRLTALKRVENRGKKTQWLFQCDCGNQKVLDPSQVKNGMIRSCGCLLREATGLRHFKDLTGQKIGRWTVLERVENENNCVKWKCQCECGEIRNVFANSLLNGTSLSCGCYKADRAHELNFDDLTGMRVGILTVIERAKEDYVSPNGSKSPQWLCKCDCGNEKIVLSGNLRGGSIRSCGCISESVSEIYIRELLDELQVEYIQEHRFDDCRNILTLPFDFYLPKYNTCIEYDGQQHFKVVDFFGGKEGFERRKHNDNIKTKYCEDKNISLLRLPYYLSRDEIKTKIENITNILNP